MKIVADDTIPFLKGIAEPEAEIVYLPARDFSPESIRDADALMVRSIDKCTPELLEGSRVKLITTATIGFDHIDTHYCASHGIVWKNAPGCNAPSVAQYLFSCLITVAFRRGEYLGDKTLGIIGVGHVGKEVERFADAFGMRVLRNDPPREEREGTAGFVSLKTLVSESDIITLHVPLSREGKCPTYHLADAEFFRHAKQGAWFINSCRGAVHDTQALLAAKEAGMLDVIIVDCWENEPNIDIRLLRMSDIVTPHIAGFSADGKATATRVCLNEIANFFGLHFRRISEVVPSSPLRPIIDLDEFPDHRVERAILQTFSPIEVDSRLRKDPTAFEFLRNHYAHPREPKAYQLLHARTDEVEKLCKIGFKFAEDN